MRLTAFSLPGIGNRTDDDGVAGDDLHPRMVAHGESRERRHRLSLRAGRHHDDFLAWMVVDLIDANLQAGRDAQIAELAGEVHDIDQRTPEKGDLSIGPDGLIDHLLNARNVGRKRSNDDSTGRAREYIGEGFADQTLGERMTGTLGVRAVGEHAQNAFLADARHCAEVGWLAVDRRLVEFEVARVEDRADRRA